MKIEEIVDACGDPVGYLTKGHVDDKVMLAEIHKKHDAHFRAHTWEHTIKRKIPCLWSDDWAFLYYDSEPGRGAFKCTVIWAPLW